jgi:hypothetical protein
MDKASWLEDSQKRVLYGEAVVTDLCKKFAIIGKDASEID